jgi:hypothetical protein
MPQPKWYHKSLAELCMDSIVDNMEKWTALRSSVHVSSLFYLLRECLFLGIIVCFLFDYAILTMHTASHCLEYMTLEWVERNHWDITKETIELLLNPHLKILDLSISNMHITDSFRIVRLASVRRSVKINSLFLYRSELMNNFLQLQQLTTLKIGFFTINQAEDTFTPILQLFEHLQILDLSGTIYGASCMINLGLIDKPKLR